jgi:hypothetical protein
MTASVLEALGMPELIAGRIEDSVNRGLMQAFHRVRSGVLDDRVFPGGMPEVAALELVRQPRV